MSAQAEAIGLPIWGLRGPESMRRPPGDEGIGDRPAPMRFVALSRAEPGSRIACTPVSCPSAHPFPGWEGAGCLREPSQWGEDAPVQDEAGRFTLSPPGQARWGQREASPL